MYVSWCEILHVFQTILEISKTYIQIILKSPSLFFFWRNSPQQAAPPHSRGFQITHKNAPHSVGILWTSNQLVSRDLYLTTHNTHNRQTSMPPVGFEPPQSQQASGSRPTPQTARPLGPAKVLPYHQLITINFHQTDLPLTTQVLISPQPDPTEKTIERSPFFVRRGSHSCSEDLVGRKNF